MKKGIIFTIILFFTMLKYASAINIGATSFIESIQTVQLSMDTTQTDATENIDSVKIGNTLLLLSGWTSDKGQSWGSYPYVTLTSATQVSAHRANTNAGDNVIVNAIVIEFKEGVVKSNQSGYLEFYTGDSEKNYSLAVPVNENKSICVCRGILNNNSNDDLGDTWFRVELANNGTTLHMIRGRDENHYEVYYQVIEFQDWVVQ